jgi:hypothetical protein
MGDADDALVELIEFLDDEATAQAPTAVDREQAWKEFQEKTPLAVREDFNHAWSAATFAANQKRDEELEEGLNAAMAREREEAQKTLRFAKDEAMRLRAELLAKEKQVADARRASHDAQRTLREIQSVLQTADTSITHIPVRTKEKNVVVAVRVGLASGVVEAQVFDELDGTSSTRGWARLAHDYTITRKLPYLPRYADNPRAVNGSVREYAVETETVKVTDYIRGRLEQLLD